VSESDIRGVEQPEFRMMIPSATAQALLGSQYYFPAGQTQPQAEQFGESCMQDPTVHRQLIASVASLKSCIRSFVLAVQPPAAATAQTAAADAAGDASEHQQPSKAQQQAAKIPGSLSRASDVTASLRKMLCAVSDQTLSLPLETSR
jgi:hypothetical protein